MVIRHHKPYKEDNLDNGCSREAALLRHAREAAEHVDEWIANAERLLQTNTVWCRQGGIVGMATECDTVPCPLKQHTSDVLSGIYKRACVHQWTLGKGVPWLLAKQIHVLRPDEDETAYCRGVSAQFYPYEDGILPIQAGR